eukprot:gene23352-24773_t
MPGVQPANQVFSRRQLTENQRGTATEPSFRPVISLRRCFVHVDGKTGAEYALDCRCDRLEWSGAIGGSVELRLNTICVQSRLMCAVADEQWTVASALQSCGLPNLREMNMTVVTIYLLVVAIGIALVAFAYFKNRDNGGAMFVSFTLLEIVIMAIIGVINGVLGTPNAMLGRLFMTFSGSYGFLAFAAICGGFCVVAGLIVSMALREKAFVNRVA